MPPTEMSQHSGLSKSMDMNTSAAFLTFRRRTSLKASLQNAKTQGKEPVTCPENLMPTWAPISAVVTCRQLFPICPQYDLMSVAGWTAAIFSICSTSTLWRLKKPPAAERREAFPYHNLCTFCSGWPTSKRWSLTGSPTAKRLPYHVLYLIWSKPTRWFAARLRYRRFKRRQVRPPMACPFSSLFSNKIITPTMGELFIAMSLRLSLLR